MVDWKFVEANWLDIIAKARENADFQKEIDFDNQGNVITACRPMVESMICAKRSKSGQLEHYLKLLGYPCRPGREIRIGVSSKMPMGTGGKGKKTKK